MSLLVIEDDSTFVELIAARLSPRTIRVAPTLKDALRLINDLPPEIVLLDLSLPDSTPAQTIKRINEIKKASKKDITVIVITGSPEIYRLHNAALCEGADYVLSKDNGFFEALNVTLLSTNRKLPCASQPVVERIEQEVRRIVESP